MQRLNGHKHFKRARAVEDHNDACSVTRFTGSPLLDAAEMLNVERDATALRRRRLARW